MAGMRPVLLALLLASDVSFVGQAALVLARHDAASVSKLKAPCPDGTIVSYLKGMREFRLTGRKAAAETPSGGQLPAPCCGNLDAGMVRERDAASRGPGGAPSPSDKREPKQPAATIEVITRDVRFAHEVLHDPSALLGKLATELGVDSSRLELVVDNPPVRNESGAGQSGGSPQGAPAPSPIAAAPAPAPQRLADKYLRFSMLIRYLDYATLAAAPGPIMTSIKEAAIRGVVKSLRIEQSRVKLTLASGSLVLQVEILDDASLPNAELLTRLTTSAAVRVSVAEAIRGVQGLEYFSSGDPEVGDMSIKVPSSVLAVPIQLLSVDPCLLVRLRTEGPYFRSEIAKRMGILPQQLLLIPPEVQGGGKAAGLSLLQQRRRFCDADLEGVSLLSRGRRTSRLNATAGQSPPAPSLAGLPPPLAAAFAPSPAAMTMWAPGPSSMSFAPAPSPGTAGSTPTVEVNFVLSGIDFSALMLNGAIRNELIEVVQAIISNAVRGVSPQDVMVQLSPGSVAVHTSILTKPEKVASLQGQLAASPNLANTLVTGVQAVTSIAAVTTGTIALAAPLQVSTGTWVGPRLSSPVLLHPAPAPAPAQGPAAHVPVNRPVIGVWALAVLPPNGAQLADNIRRVVNTLHGSLSGLLPLTLARVPDLGYPSFTKDGLPVAPLPAPLQGSIDVGPEPGGTRGNDLDKAARGVAAVARQRIEEGMALQHMLAEAVEKVGAAFRLQRAEIADAEDPTLRGPEVAPPWLMPKVPLSKYGPWAPGEPLADAGVPQSA